MIQDGQKLSLSSTEGTLRWLAPELLRPSGDQAQISFATDIYAFACVCYEVSHIIIFLYKQLISHLIIQVFSGKIPFYEEQNEVHIAVQVTLGARPSLPPQDICRLHGLDYAMWSFIEYCWEAQPSVRPTAVKIVSYLQGRLNKVHDKRLASFSSHLWSLVPGSGESAIDFAYLLKHYSSN